MNPVKILNMIKKVEAPKQDTIYANDDDIDNYILVSLRGDDLCLIQRSPGYKNFYSEMVLSQDFTKGNLYLNGAHLESIIKVADDVVAIETLKELGEFIANWSKEKRETL